MPIRPSNPLAPCGVRGLLWLGAELPVGARVFAAIGQMEQMMNRCLEVLVRLVVVLSLTAIVTTTVSAQEATPGANAGQVDLAAATDWLMGQQQDDGGFPGFSGESDPSITIDAIFALVAAQVAGVDTGDSIERAVAYLESGEVALVFAQTGAGQAAKLVLAVVATGGNPRDVAGVDALSLLEQGPDPDTGLYGTGVFDHAYVILALSAAGADVPTEAIDALASTQGPEGGWAFDGMTTEGAADSNTTALVVQALVAAGEADNPMTQDALTYLGSAVADTGGAVFQPGTGTPPDTSSTSFVVQALIAVGEDPASEDWGDVASALAEFQNESGAFHFNPDDTTDNIFSTVQAIPAAAGAALPLQSTATTALAVGAILEAA